MPHFILDCSENILKLQSPVEVMAAVYDAADSTGLFAKGDIKVRIRPFQYFKLGEGKKDFLTRENVALRDWSITVGNSRWSKIFRRSEVKQLGGYGDAELVVRR